MCRHSLRVFLRATVYNFVQTCILIVHSGRGYDLFVGGHHTMLDVITAMDTYQHGDPVLVWLAVIRAAMAVMGSTHAGATLARDQWRWWSHNHDR